MSARQSFKVSDLNDNRSTHNLPIRVGLVMNIGASHFQALFLWEEIHHNIALMGCMPNNCLDQLSLHLDIIICVPGFTEFVLRWFIRVNLALIRTPLHYGSALLRVPKLSLTHLDFL